MYAESFQHRSSTELYGAAPTSVAADVITAVGPHALIEVTSTHLGGGRPVAALDLTDMVVAAAPGHAGARSVARAAPERFLVDTENFWVRAWLTKNIDGLKAANEHRYIRFHRRPGPRHRWH
jgi:hypothetical protein